MYFPTDWALSRLFLVWDACPTDTNAYQADPPSTVANANLIKGYALNITDQNEIHLAGLNDLIVSSA